MKHEPTYRDALRFAWDLAWRHKMLWIFGLFASFLGQMGVLELFLKVGLVSTDFAFYPAWLILPEFAPAAISAASLSHVSLPLDGWLWLLWLVLILLGFAAFFLFVAVVSQGGIIHATAKHTGKKKLPDVGQAWHVGVRHFWRLLFLNLFKKITIVALAVAMGFATVNVLIDGSGGDGMLFWMLFVLAAIVGMVVSIVVVYAAGYVVVEEYPFWDALGAGWHLLWRHWLVSLEVALIILLLNIALAVAVLASFFVLFIPTLLLWVAAVEVVSTGLYLLAIVLGIFLFVTFIVFLGSLFTVFSTSAWTYLFMKMHKKGLVSRILHFGGHS